jgi:hypothetical protein
MPPNSLSQGAELPLQNQDGLLVAGIPNVFFNCWLQAPSIERLENLIRIQRDFAARQSAPKHVVVTLIDPKAGREMDPAARKRAQELGTSMAPLTAARLFVVLADGFYAAMVRTAISGVLLLSREVALYSVVTDVEAGVKWLEKSLESSPGLVDGARVRKALQDIIQTRSQWIAHKD